MPLRGMVAAGSIPVRRKRWLRWRTLRRRLFLVLCGLGIGVAMAISVRRSAEARKLSQELEVFSAAESATRDRVQQELRRTDSLSSRSRIRRVAGELGLRPATDREIVFLEDVDALSSHRPTE